MFVLEAELNGKLPILENQEDVLTSNTFGLFKYLSDNRVLVNILNKSETINGKKLEKCHSYNLLEYQPEIIFWKNLGKYGEPDIIIRFRSPSKEDLYIGIEVKFYSSKSGEGDDDQLMRYFNAIEQLSIMNDSQFLGIIYLTKHSSNIEIKDTLDCLKNKKIMNCEEKIFQLRWHNITSAISDYCSKDINDQDKAILGDLHKYLIFKNLVSFNEFSYLKDDFLITPDKFYETEMKYCNFKGFTYINKEFRVDSDGRIFYG